MTHTNEPSGHIFLLRLWPVEGTAESSQWRGKVQNIVRGEAANFTDLSALAECLLAMLPAPTANPDPQVKTREEHQE
jgi:hypothetical protein